MKDYITGGILIAVIILAGSALLHFANYPIKDKQICKREIQGETYRFFTENGQIIKILKGTYMPDHYDYYMLSSDQNIDDLVTIIQKVESKKIANIKRLTCE